MARHGILQILFLLQLPFLTIAQVNFTSSNIPIIVIETNSLEIPDEYSIIANMGIINNESGLRNNMSDPFNDFEGYISIEIRGSTSKTFPKKSYGLETKDNSGDDLKAHAMFSY